MRFPLRFALAAACGLAACSDSSTSPAPIIPTLQFSSATPAYVKLDSPATVTNAANWDMRFSVTGVRLNGGTSGSGSVTGYCLCENVGKSAGQILALDANNTAAAYQAIDASSIPSLSAFIADSVTPVISGWANGTTSVSANTYVVKIASTPGAQVKFSVTAFTNPTTTSPGTITITYASRSSSTAEFGAPSTLDIPVPTTGSAYVDFTQGTVTPGTTAPTTWDVRVAGYKMFVNGGVSGTAGVTVLPVIQGAQPYAPFAQVNRTLLAPVPPLAFSADDNGGAFTSSTPSRKWYEYNLTGNHDITPTFNTYLIKTPTGIFKVQVTSFYNTAGQGSNISIRSAKIANVD